MALKERKYSLAASFKYLQILRETYCQNINDFISNSTINGLQYFKRQDLTMADRFYFIVAFVAAVASSIYFIGLVAQKWSYSPTIISLNPIHSHIINDPFPAVTICNMNLALKSRASQYPAIPYKVPGNVALRNSRSSVVAFSNLRVFFCHEIVSHKNHLQFGGDLKSFHLLDKINMHIMDNMIPNSFLHAFKKLAKGQLTILGVYVESLKECLEEYAMLQPLCSLHPNTTLAHSIKDWNIVGDFISNVSQSCERMLLECRFGGYQFNCSGIFRQVLTDEGLCCTFNSLDPVFKFINGSKRFRLAFPYPPEFKTVDWAIEKGYQKPIPEYTYPMRNVGMGQTLGLNVILNVESEEYYCSSGNSIGFKVTLHSPEDEPMVHETGVLVSPGYESLVRIIPSKTFADEKMRKINMKLRKCVFENEKNLTLFSHYTYTNCLYECRVEIIRSYCGCVSTHLISRYSNLTICNSGNRKCIQNIPVREWNCERTCLYGCFTNRYRVSVFSAKLETTGREMNSPSLRNMSIAYVQENIAMVKFYFKHSSYETVKQDPFIGPIDVLSSIGGLISIFFGFSFMSLVEFIYYICIRPLRSIILKKSPEREVYLRKPRRLLANRPKTRFVNPYKQYTRPKEVWYINRFSIPNPKAEEM